MQYTTKTISKDEQIKLFGRQLRFSHKFVDEQRIDWWNILDRHFGQPVVMVRPAGDQIIVSLADGSIAADDKRLLDYNSESDLKSVLSDIFKEADNDEYEVFESYAPGPKCPGSVWDTIVEWVHEFY
jgi:hypothetical protein